VSNLFAQNGKCLPVGGGQSEPDSKVPVVSLASNLSRQYSVLKIELSLIFELEYYRENAPCSEHRWQSPAAAQRGLFLPAREHLKRKRVFFGKKSHIFAKIFLTSHFRSLFFSNALVKRFIKPKNSKLFEKKPQILE
jgi:hypothetical protein